MLWTRWIFIFSILLGAAVLGFSIAGHSAATGIPPLAARVTPKRISQKDFVKMMPQIAKDLGVTCGYCHVNGDFKKMTDKKRVALYMKTEFVEKLQARGGQNVTCFTCHQGHAQFLDQAEGDKTK